MISGTDIIVCEINNCKKPFCVICDDQLGYISFGWKPCERKLCKDHYTGSSRCHTIP